METARTEHCPECHGTSMHNHFHFVQAKRPRVYVQCASCGAFVARYSLDKYTSDKPYESLLSILSTHHGDSVQQIMKQVEGFGREVATGFERVIGMVGSEEDQRRIEEIMAEEDD